MPRGCPGVKNPRKGSRGPRVTTAKAFWSKVRISEGCWEWTGKRQIRIDGSEPYGRMLVAGKEVYAHRTAWELQVGPIPDGLLVCHHCDNRLCVRPDHLFVGTQKENIQDNRKKGRKFGPGCRGLSGKCSHPEHWKA